MLLLSRPLWFALLLSCSACQLIVDFTEIRDDAGVAADASADASADRDADRDADARSMDANTEAPAADATRGDERSSDVGSSDAEAMPDRAATVADAMTEAGAAVERDAGGESDGAVDASPVDASPADASAMRCDATKPVGSNGCPSTAALCKLDAGGVATCAGCLVNADCGVGAFCDTASGACTSVCDPDGAVGDNGCSGATPYCATGSAGYTCRACVASDCAGATPHCAASGARAGSCVACRDTNECSGDPQRPICDVASASCRAAAVTDCTGATPAFVNGRCVECSSDASCAGAAGRPWCDGKNQCVSCAALPPEACIERSRATPFCNASTGSCVRCMQSSDCSAQLTPSVTPICLDSACVACSATAAPNPDSMCSMGLGGPICVLSGPQAGRCGMAP